MKKKKIGILVSTALVIAVMGGTLAWFTAEDSLVNKFTTAGVPSDDPEDGVEIDENEEWKDEDGDGEYENEEAKDVTPGTEVNKDVRAKNTATYDSFIRMKIEAEFTEAPFNTNPNDELLLLNLNPENITTAQALEEGKWVDGGDGYYYYLKVVAQDEFTSYLLDSVTLSSEADNSYKNSKYDVKATAEGIQASNGASADEWNSANSAVIEKLNELSGFES